ncbi:MAG: ATP-binding protein [Acidobacteria bacterium]|nr:ATP-binding protein [Acidobacteriota bacterium]
MTSGGPICPDCGGTGWKPVEAPARGVVRCECMAQASLERRLRAARIPPRYEHCSFESFQTNLHHENPAYDESLRQARFLAERFVAEYPAQADFGLLFMGPCGTGKTHLGVAIVRALAEKGADCLFYDFRELLKEIQSSYNPVAETTEMEVLAPVLESEVLLLDDLGASKPSAWVLDTVAHILNTRYNNKRVTLITTNYLDAPTTRPSASGVVRDDTLADRIGERMRSRLYEMCRVVPVEAEDFRRRVKQAQYHFR